MIAYFATRKGGSGARSMHSLADIESVLRGEGGIKTARIVTKNGEEIGWRERHDDGKYFWSYDAEAAAEEFNA
jgi:hypothetical protein